MQCPDASELMSLSMDTQLDAAQEQRLAEHLRSCEACRTLCENMQAACELFRDPEMALPPVDLTARVMTRVRRQSRPFAAARNLLLVLLAGLVLLAVGAVPLIGLAVTAFSDASAFNAALQAALRLASLMGTLLGSLDVIFRALLTGPQAAVAIVGLVVAIGLGFVWYRLVTWQGRPYAQSTS